MAFNFKKYKSAVTGTPFNKNEKTAPKEELVKIPRKKIQPIDMTPYEEAAEGRYLINREKQDRIRMTKMAKEHPEMFYKTYGKSPSEYLSSLPYG